MIQKSNNFIIMEKVKQEMPRALSYKKWGAVLVDLYRQEIDKRKFMQAMKFGGININGINVTPLDFFSTARNLTNTEIEEAIAGYLEVDSIGNNIEALNDALYYSREYTTNYLLRKLPREIMNLQIKNTQDVLRIFKKTSTLKLRENQGFGPAYCELIKTMVGNFMFDKKELQYLIKETEYFYNEMFNSRRDERPLNVIKKFPGDYDKIIGVQFGDLILPGKSPVMAEAYYRGKSRNSFITKFLIKPDSNVQEAVKDGIGLKMEADDRESIKSLMGMVLRELFLQFNVQKVEIENTRLFNPEMMMRLEQQIRDFVENLKYTLEDIGSKNLITITEDNNPHSDSQFRAIKICEGELNIPRGGVQGAMTVNRNFEVQFVLSNNSNEDNFSNHYVYEAKKKLAATTRNIGTFPENYLDTIVHEASYKSGLGFDNIKQHFLDNFLSNVISSRGKAKRFVVKKRVLELMETEMFYKGVQLR